MFSEIGIKQPAVAENLSNIKCCHGNKTYRNSKVVTVNVHQLHLKLRGSFLVCRGGERGEECEVRGGERGGERGEECEVVECTKRLKE